MFRSFLLFISLLFFFGRGAIAQNTKPKLVVGLVVDQMRWDFLYRYSNLYGSNGIKRLFERWF